MPTTVVNTTDTTPSKKRDVFGLVFGALLTIANLSILAAAWQDRSWGALAIALVVGPSINGVILISGLVTIQFLKRYHPHLLLRRHVAVTVGVPLAAVVADCILIFSMGLHGC